jgi:hypothetical protein
MHDRRPPRLPSFRVPGAVLAVALLVAACGAAGSPTASPPQSPLPSSTPGAALSREAAVAKILAQDPRFQGIGPLDPNLIGQSAWYEVSPATVGWRVVITKGWGDCQAGCISRHTWTYDIDPSGVVTLVAEGGDPLPDGSGGDGSGAIPPSPPVAIPDRGGPWIAGRALAGPTCPVVQNPPDPACAERPVAGALVIVRRADGSPIGQATTNPDGTYLVAVPGGGPYTVEAQPVEGVMGTPAPIAVVVPDGAASWAVADLAYDTGIR